VRLSVLRQIPEDPALRRDWNALVARSGDAQVFYTYEWALAVQRAYSEVLRPFIFLAYDEANALRGVAALAESAEKEVSFLCATTGDYCDFLSSREDRAEFVASVFSALRAGNTASVTLTNLPADSPTEKAIRKGARDAGYHVFARLAYDCAQYSTKVLDRAKNEKPRVARPKMIRRALKAMSAGGTIRVDHIQSAGAAADLLPAFTRAHVGRFLVTNRISNLARPERRVFLSELTHLLADSGWLCLTRMMAGDRIIAWNYGFRFHGSWFWYQPTFESDLEKHSPGYCLLAKIVEEAAENPEFHTVDLGLGAEDYKGRVANQSRKTLCVNVDTALTRHLMTMCRYGASRLAQASPVIEKALRSGRDALQFLKKRVNTDGSKATFLWGLRRLRTSCFSRDEVLFYEFTANSLAKSNSLTLVSIDLDVLAEAAMQYPDEEGTLAYLLRCAPRLHKDCSGFALLNPQGEFVHFTWAGPFSGFHWSELNSTLPSPSPDSVILFDSWTPVAQRGKGYYAPTLALVSERIHQQGKRAWGFSAATNTSSIRGLEKMGFPRRFTVVRRKLLWWQWLKQEMVESTVNPEVLTAC